jgi:putative transposase
MVKAHGGTTSSSNASGRTIKYEDVYLRAYDSVYADPDWLARPPGSTNTWKSHSSLAGRTPYQPYRNLPKSIPVAA